MATRNPQAPASAPATPLAEGSAPEDVAVKPDGTIVPAATAAASTPKVKARVLVDGVFGKADDVVEVTEEEAQASGQLDANPAAVQYAESLVKPEPEAE